MDNRKRKGDVRNITPSSKVKRCLFGKAHAQECTDDNESYEQKCRELDEKKLLYNYDFEKDEKLQLSNTRYTVAKVEVWDNSSSVTSQGKLSNRTVNVTSEAWESCAETETRPNALDHVTGDSQETKNSDDQSNNNGEVKPDNSQGETLPQF